MVYKIDNDFYDDDDEYQCSTCFGFASSSNSSATQKHQTLNSNFKKQKNQNQQNHPNREEQQENIDRRLSSKDLVGNNKEFRMESNKCNLRIIGNGNRIRIARNSGSLQIVGNSTRLKIAQNSGSIKYTGNEGRICLGSESTQQIVDYVGCNGLLKVINSAELNKSPKCSENNSSSDNSTPTSISDKVIKDNSKRKHLAGNAATGTLPQHSSSSSAAAAAVAATGTSSSFTPLVKSASFEELVDVKNFTDFLQHDAWQHLAKVSLPDLKENINEQSVCGCKCKKMPNKIFINNLNKKSNNSESRNKNSRTHFSGNCKGINISSHRNVVNHFGDIVISNSVNVSIA